MSSSLAPRAGRAIVCTAVALVASAAGSVVSTAAAADACRASAVRESTNTVITAEPIVANSPSTPCTTQRADLTQTTLPLGLVVTDPTAATRRAPGVLAADTALVGATLSGPTPISVGAIRASQTQSCVDGRSVAAGSSSVLSLTVAGQPVVLPSGRPVDLTVGIVRVRANQVAGDTRRALVLDVAGEQIVLGEATAGGDACAVDGGQPGGGTGGGGTTPPGLCPAGATFDAGANRCVIADAGGTIDVSAPFEGPVGGTVLGITIARTMAARGELPRSRCLSGRGPRYVVVGTGRGDRIAGTSRRDRILGLGGADRIDGGRAHDCLDGGAGADRLYGGFGNDRGYGGAGLDREFGQAGDDRLHGGTGPDRLYGASGDDRQRGAAGDDRIVLGSGRDRIRAGRGRDYVNAVSARRNSAIDMQGGRDRVFIRRAQAPHVRHAERVRFVR